jgi:hypothetical protein
MENPMQCWRRHSHWWSQPHARWKCWCEPRGLVGSFLICPAGTSKSVLPTHFLLFLQYYQELDVFAWIHWLFLGEIQHHHIHAFCNIL